MPTNIQVKADIDTDITSKTLPNTVTNTNVGARMKSVVDYAVQELALKQNSDELSTVAISGEYDDLTGKPTIVTKVLKTTITSAQILALFDTPITVLDSSNPETIKLPLNIWCQRQPGTAYTLAAASFLLVNDAGGNVSGNLNPNPLTGTDIGFFTSAYSITQNLAGGDRNNLYQLKASVGNPTGGTGNIDVYVTYIEITL